MCTCVTHLVEFVWCGSNMELKQQLSENANKLLAVGSCAHTHAHVSILQGTQHKAIDESTLNRVLRFDFPHAEIIIIMFLFVSS